MLTIDFLSAWCCRLGPNSTTRSASNRGLADTPRTSTGASRLDLLADDVVALMDYLGLERADISPTVSAAWSRD